MAQTITAVNKPNIEHGMLLALTVPNSVTGITENYYISNCYTNVVFQGNTYIAMGSFLNISEIQGDLQSTNNDISVSLSGIPSQDQNFDVLQTVLAQQIKGSRIKLSRAFFDTETQLVLAGQVFLRFDGVITNYAVNEDFSSSITNVDVAHTITVTASSILSILENRVSGRRTNRKSFQIYYPEAYITQSIVSDPSLNKIEALRNASFDFGKPLAS